MILDVIVYISPIIIALAATLLYSISTMRKTNKLATSMVKGMLLSFTLTLLACICWFFYESEGFGQLFGWAIYVGCFVLIAIIDITVLVILRKNKDKLIVG